MSITVTPERCVGCRLCELACSFAHQGSFNPQQAAIRVIFHDDGRLSISTTEVCAACRLPLCAVFCPAGAIVGGPDRAPVPQA